MKKIFIATAVSLALASSAFASSSLAGLYVGVQGGYGNISSPSGNIDAPSLVNVPAGVTASEGIDHKIGNFVYNFNLGYRYALTPKFLLGAELAYDSNLNSHYGALVTATDGSVSGTEKEGINYKQNDIALFLTGTYLINNSFDIFAKVGYARVDTKLTGDRNISLAVAGQTTRVPLAGLNKSKISYKPIIALGFGFMPIQHLEVYAQYQHLFAGTTNWNDSSFSSYDSTNNQFDNGSVSALSTNTLSVGVNYTFPL